MEQIILISIVVILVFVVIFLVASKSNPTPKPIGKGSEKPTLSIWQRIFTSAHQRKIDIFVYGHSASGKSSFIQRTFTLGVEPLVSTPDLSYYEFDETVDLDKSTGTIKIRIADYRGQDPAQILEAIQKNTHIDCLIFMADISPAYHHTRRKYSDDEVLGLLTENVEEVIHERLKDHEDYLNRFLLQIVFKYAMNPNLKKVYLVINKIDFLQELQKRGTIPRNVDIEDYAKSFFLKIEDNINTFCVNNDITHFKVYCVSSHTYYNTRLILSDIINS
jgi:GTPase SAR1 family protein